MDLLRPLGLLGFVFLLTLIVLYLKRPRPEKKEIPSLMFLMKQTGKNQKNRLKNLISNLLFFVQALIVSLLAFALALPVLPIDLTTDADSVVWVVDVSASSAAHEGSRTRLDIAKDHMLANLASQNAIILAKGDPEILAGFEGKSKTKRLVESLSTVYSGTNLGDAILAAGDLLKERNGKVVVLSDFIQTEGSDVIVAAKSLTSKGIPVEMVESERSAQNVGITDVTYTGTQLTVEIKNYMADPVKVTLEYSIGGEVQHEKEQTLLPYSMDTVTFPLLSGNGIISLSPSDDFQGDNRLYVTVPFEEQKQVLLITNNPNSFMYLGLKSMAGIQVKVGEPPIIPQEKFGFYVVSDVDPELILPGTFPDILTVVEEGATLLVVGQDGLSQTEVYESLPVEVHGRVGEQEIKGVSSLFGAEDMSLGTVSSLLNVTLRDDAMEVAHSSMGIPAIASRKQGRGTVVYMGIEEEASDLKLTPYFPMLLNNIINTYSGSELLSRLNVKTGTSLSVEGREVVAPDGPRYDNVLVFDVPGFYSVGQNDGSDHMTYGANMLNPLESDVSAEGINGNLLEAGMRSDQFTVQFQMLPSLIIVALILLFVELLLLKYRGDA